MRRGDEVLDCAFVVLEPGVDVGCVEDAGALGLREDEVEEEEEADVGVEGNPGGWWLVLGRMGWRREIRNIPHEKPLGPALN